MDAARKAVSAKRPHRAGSAGERRGGALDGGKGDIEVLMKKMILDYLLESRPHEH